MQALPVLQPMQVMWQLSEALILSECRSVLILAVNKGNHVLPGGYAEPGEDAHQALIHGVHSDIGLTVEPQWVLATQCRRPTTWNAPGNVLTFDCTDTPYLPTGEMTLGPRVHTARWVPASDIADYLPPDISFRVSAALESLDQKAGTPYLTA